MDLTDDQITILRQQWHAAFNMDDGFRNVIDKWESIRTKDQAAPGLQWRPITKAIPGCVIALCPLTGAIVNYSNPALGATGGYTHYLDHSELAALPLMPAPNPTPEEIDRQEFKAVFLAKYPELDFDSDFAQGALDGWRQAKNQQTISA